jgi:hypothetical protein
VQSVGDQVDAEELDVPEGDLEQEWEDHDQALTYG